MKGQELLAQNLNRTSIQLVHEHAANARLINQNLRINIGANHFIKYA